MILPLQLVDIVMTTRFSCDIIYYTSFVNFVRCENRRDITSCWRLSLLVVFSMADSSALVFIFTTCNACHIGAYGSCT